MKGKRGERERERERKSGRDRAKSMERKKGRNMWNVCTNTLNVDRKDKYEKKLLWFYTDIAFEGVRSEKDEEQLDRSTQLGETTSGKVPLGLSKASQGGGSVPPVSSSDEEANVSSSGNSGSEGESSTESAGKRSGKGSNGSRKKAKSSKVSEEVPDEERPNSERHDRAYILYCRSP